MGYRVEERLSTLSEWIHALERDRNRMLEENTRIILHVQQLERKFEEMRVRLSELDNRLEYNDIS